MAQSARATNTKVLDPIPRLMTCYTHDGTVECVTWLVYLPVMT